MRPTKKLKLFYRKEIYLFTLNWKMETFFFLSFIDVTASFLPKNFFKNSVSLSQKMEISFKEK